MASEYRTFQGDTWDMIAYKTLGNERHFPLMMRANPEWSDVVIFDAGIILAVPALPEEISDDLPPWKRGDTD